VVGHNEVRASGRIGGARLRSLGTASNPIRYFPLVRRAADGKTDFRSLWFGRSGQKCSESRCTRRRIGIRFLRPNVNLRKRLPVDTLDDEPNLAGNYTDHQLYGDDSARYMLPGCSGFAHRVRRVKESQRQKARLIGIGPRRLAGPDGRVCPVQRSTCSAPW
jgi:hypothetical protein